MRDDTKASWFQYYRALLAGREEEDLSFDKIQTLVAKAKAEDEVARRESERKELEAAHAKFHRPSDAVGSYAEKLPSGWWQTS